MVIHISHPYSLVLQISQGISCTLKVKVPCLLVFCVSSTWCHGFGMQCAVLVFHYDAPLLFKHWYMRLC